MDIDQLPFLIHMRMELESNHWEKENPYHKMYLHMTQNIRITVIRIYHVKYLLHSAA
jgi:hypothetical protein